MDYTYINVIDPITEEISTKVILRSDGWYIPIDPANSDYQAYLKSLDEAASL